MPLYEYECKKCGRITEALQKFSDPPLSDCPHCKGRMNKLISLGTFHLKGNGWYVTDYAGKNAGNQSSHGKDEGGGTKVEEASKKEDSTNESHSSD
jgi:putative FmdB family regulatory protein